jgi:hypothetical protein
MMIIEKLDKLTKQWLIREFDTGQSQPHYVSKLLTGEEKSRVTTLARESLESENEQTLFQKTNVRSY